MLPYVDEPQPDPAGDGSRDAAVGELELGVVDLRLVDLGGRFELLHEGALGVQLLLRQDASG